MPFYARLKTVLLGNAPGFRLKDELMVRSRLGVKPILIGLSLALSAATLSSCASAPIDMLGAPQGEATAGQVELRSAANALADRLEEAGWTLGATPAETRRSFFDRLIGGGSDEDEGEPKDDPVTLYLATASTPQAVEADLARLIDGADDVAAQTLSVASSDDALSARTLADDLAAVERALGAVRRATAFFEAVLAQGGWEEAAAYALTAQLETARAAETRLAASADALAERRWAARSGLFG